MRPSIEATHQTISVSSRIFVINIPAKNANKSDKNVNKITAPIITPII